MSSSERHVREECGKYKDLGELLLLRVGLRDDLLLLGLKTCNFYPCTFKLFVQGTVPALAAIGWSILSGRSELRYLPSQLPAEIKD
jgi:hypothetical protein